MSLELHLLAPHLLPASSGAHDVEGGHLLDVVLEVEGLNPLLRLDIVAK